MSLNTILGLGLFLVVSVGLVSAFVLTGLNQDIRQQAINDLGGAGGGGSPCGGSCSSGQVCISGQCVSNSGTQTPQPTSQATSNPSSGPSVGGSVSSCNDDGDCSGDRVCDDGRCVTERISCCVNGVNTTKTRDDCEAANGTEGTCAAPGLGASAGSRTCSTQGLERCSAGERQRCIGNRWTRIGTCTTTGSGGVSGSGVGAGTGSSGGTSGSSGGVSASSIPTSNTGTTTSTCRGTCRRGSCSLGEVTASGACTSREAVCCREPAASVTTTNCFGNAPSCAVQTVVGTNCPAGFSRSRPSSCSGAAIAGTVDRAGNCCLRNQTVSINQIQCVESGGRLGRCLTSTTTNSNTSSQTSDTTSTQTNSTTSGPCCLNGLNTTRRSDLCTAAGGTLGYCKISCIAQNTRASASQNCCAGLRKCDDGVCRSTCSAATQSVCSGTTPARCSCSSGRVICARSAGECTEACQDLASPSPSPRTVATAPTTTGGNVNCSSFTAATCPTTCEVIFGSCRPRLTTSTSCSTFTNQTVCQLNGCTFANGVCSGSAGGQVIVDIATSCSDLNGQFGSCLARVGCYYEGGQCRSTADRPVSSGNYCIDRYQSEGEFSRACSTVLLNAGLISQQQIPYEQYALFDEVDDLTAEAQEWYNRTNLIAENLDQLTPGEAALAIAYQATIDVWDVFTFGGVDSLQSSIYQTQSTCVSQGGLLSPECRAEVVSTLQESVLLSSSIVLPTSQTLSAVTNNPIVRDVLNSFDVVVLSQSTGLTVGEVNQMRQVINQSVGFAADVVATQVSPAVLSVVTQVVGAERAASSNSVNTLLRIGSRVGGAGPGRTLEAVNQVNDLVTPTNSAVNLLGGDNTPDTVQDLLGTAGAPDYSSNILRLGAGVAQ
jgi:hypothetical protein